MTTTMELENSKLHSLEESVAIREALRKEGQRFVLTNGCFDLLHPGHVSYLKEAKGLGDVLWIALNGETSVAALKGPNRPVMNDAERAYMLASLECVDGVVIFNTERLNAEIRTLKPDIYAKAGDYTIETLDKGERAALEDVGAQIEFIPFLEGYSTTSFIAKLKSL